MRIIQLVLLGTFMLSTPLSFAANDAATEPQSMKQQLQKSVMIFGELYETGALRYDDEETEMRYFDAYINLRNLLMRIQKLSQTLQTANEIIGNRATDPEE